MLRVCKRCGSVEHRGPAVNVSTDHYCDRCTRTPDLPLFNQCKPRKPKSKTKRKRHPAEGGPDPVTGEK